jgi:arsenite oxidase small subunit
MGSEEPEPEPAAAAEPAGAVPRRTLMQRAACLAGAWAASGLVPVVAGETRSHARSLLVDALGDPIAARRLRIGEPWLFNYPFVASPVFLLALDQAPPGAELVTESRQRYAAPAGVGPKKTIVAFSAICAHKLVYPTPSISFIGVRRGNVGEPPLVIHCCGDDSRYDPAAGGRVMSGPAPQPLAAVLLDWDPATDRLWATGTRGGEMFGAFFDKYAFKLEMELGSRARSATGDTAVARPATDYSRQWQTCRA